MARTSGSRFPPAAVKCYQREGCTLGLHGSESMTGATSRSKACFLPPSSLTRIAATEDIRFCEQCCEFRPLTEFRRRSRAGTGRMHQCRQCHNQSERMRREKRRAKRERSSVATWLTRIKNERSNARLEFLIGAMLHQFGGMENYVAAYADYHRHAMQQGEFAAYRCLQSLFRLLELREAKEPDPYDMTDEELEHYLAEQTKAAIRLQPELAVAAAKELGWSVIPGDTVADGEGLPVESTLPIALSHSQ